MTIKFTTAKRERDARRYTVEMSGGVATCDCQDFKRHSDRPCQHISAIRTGTYITK